MTEPTIDLVIRTVPEISGDEYKFTSFCVTQIFSGPDEFKELMKKNFTKDSPDGLLKSTKLSLELTCLGVAGSVKALEKSGEDITGTLTYAHENIDNKVFSAQHISAMNEDDVLETIEGLSMGARAFTSQGEPIITGKEEISDSYNEAARALNAIRALLQRKSDEEKEDILIETTFRTEDFESVNMKDMIEMFAPVVRYMAQSRNYIAHSNPRK